MKAQVTTTALIIIGLVAGFSCLAQTAFKCRKIEKSEISYEFKKQLDKRLLEYEVVQINTKAIADFTKEKFREGAHFDLTLYFGEENRFDLELWP
ncbi:hypothetical protein JYT51_02380, partial [Candidatus Amoebophilus asiaticus]|nr:hypothetical protein [Candidatus Amoebophilus asiaticus]